MAAVLGRHRWGTVARATGVLALRRRIALMAVGSRGLTVMRLAVGLLVLLSLTSASCLARGISQKGVDPAHCPVSKDAPFGGRTHLRGIIPAGSLLRRIVPLVWLAVATAVLVGRVVRHDGVSKNVQVSWMKVEYDCGMEKRGRAHLINRRTWDKRGSGN